MSDISEQKPNIHYIAVIEEANGQVVYRKYPIEHPRSLLTFLKETSFDQDHGDLPAMQDAMLKHYPQDQRGLCLKSFLAPVPYFDSYVDVAQFPRIVTAQEYTTLLENVRNSTAKQYREECRRRSEENLPPLKNTEEETVDAAVRTWRITMMRRYHSEAARFIASHSYLKTLEQNHIAQRLRSNDGVKMFSTDTIGWTTYFYEINKDISIRFDSNFGYGPRVGYFQLGLSYKGIEILPYSAYVRYYYANWRTLMAHTRSYGLERSSWDYAMEFVEKHANLALTDPAQFVDTFIIGEVKKMVEGLNSITGLSKDRFKEQINPRNPLRPRYLGVSSARANDMAMYRAYPREMLMAYKAEKITGALAFLGNIKRLAGVLSQIAPYYDEIIELVRGLVPQIKADISLIEKDILELEEKKRPYVEKLEPLQKELDRMNAEISALIEVSDKAQPPGEKSWDQLERRKRIREGYQTSHPEYGQTSTLCSELKTIIAQIDSDIRGRRGFAVRLSNCEAIAQETNSFKEVVDEIRPHENEIEAMISAALSKCDVSKMNPTQIKSLRGGVNLAYIQSHPDYSELLKKREVMLKRIDGLVLSNVR